MNTDNNQTNKTESQRAEYRSLRQRIGSQRLASQLLGISEDTVRLRELGQTQMKPEYLYVLRYMAMQIGYVVDHNLE